MEQKGPLQGPLIVILKGSFWGFVWGGPLRFKGSVGLFKTYKALVVFRV